MPSCLARLTPVLDQLVAATRSSAAALQVNLVDLLRFPGVLREAAADPEAQLAAGRNLFAAALADLKKMRASEGARLKELVANAATSSPRSSPRCGRACRKCRLAFAAASPSALPSSVLQSTASAWNRKSRCCCSAWMWPKNWIASIGHLEETRKIIASPEAAGRRLDFLMQEFNREANTLSSKSQDLATTRLAVDMKVLIEQMREQVQNIE